MHKEVKVMYFPEKKPKEKIYMFKRADEWGYFTDLRHPRILEEFKRFKTENAIPPWAALSDDERHSFDCIMAHKYRSEWLFCQDELYGGHYEGNRFIPSAVRLEGCTADSA